MSPDEPEPSPDRPTNDRSPHVTLLATPSSGVSSVPPRVASAFRRPQAEGLYDPALDHDACGVAFVATLSGVPSHSIVEQGLEALRNLDHRGATGSDPRTGDGAGILMQVPDGFLRSEAGFDLPSAGSYAVGNAFLPVDEAAREAARATIERVPGGEGRGGPGWGGGGPPAGGWSSPTAPRFPTSPDRPCPPSSSCS